MSLLTTLANAVLKASAVALGITLVQLAVKEIESR